MNRLYNLEHMSLRKIAFIASAFILVIWSAMFTPQLSLAQTPSAAQIAQFQNLSAADQQALAESYGINLNSASGSGGNTTTLQTEAISGSRNQTNMLDEQGEEIESFSSDGTQSPSLTEDSADASIDEELVLFGYDLFKQGADAFAPAADIPVPANYILGPGDNIIVQLYGKENTTH